MHPQSEYLKIISLLLPLSSNILVHAKVQQRTPLLTVFGPQSANHDISLARRQATCFDGETVCGSGCIPSTGMCCPQASGIFCPSGTYCNGVGDDAGCCESGKSCEESAGGCLGDTEPCGDLCMIIGSVCCGKIACRPGGTCTANGCVYNGGSSSAGSGSNSGSNATRTTGTASTSQNTALTSTTTTRATGDLDRTTTASGASQTDVQSSATRPLLAGMSLFQLFLSL